MQIEKGGPLFLEDGRPALVRSHDRITGRVEVDARPKETREAHRHGYVTGLGSQRVRFNEIMDAVKAEEDPMERIRVLTGRISAVESELTPESLYLARYLRSELAHLMNSNNVRPQIFTLQNAG